MPRKYAGPRMPGQRSAKVPGLNKKQRASVANIAKKTLMKTAETKVSEFSTENVQLYHNVLEKTENNSLYTTQGPTDGDTQGTAENRIGDMIQAQKIWWKIQLFNKQDRPNLHYRVLVVRQQTDRTGTYEPSLPAAFELETLNGNGNLLFASSSQERSTVVFDRIYRVQNQQSLVNSLDVGHEVSRIINVNYKIPKSHQKVLYHDGGSVPKRFIYLMYIVPYDSYGTLTTDNIASYAYSRKTYYKDI